MPILGYQATFHFFTVLSFWVGGEVNFMNVFLEEIFLTYH